MCLASVCIASGLTNLHSLCSIHIVLLPCILVSSSAVCIEKAPDIFQGYDIIANRLLRDPNTIRSMCSLHWREMAGLTPFRHSILFFVDSSKFGWELGYEIQKYGFTMNSILGLLRFS